MDDATSRAREAWQAERILATIADALLNDHEAMDCMEQAETIVASLNAVDFQIIDTRTHAAVPRDPLTPHGEEIVAKAMLAASCGQGATVHGISDDTREFYVHLYRAAIAALVGTQTQGGEREDV